jgi:hypothetical protein
LSHTVRSIITVLLSFHLSDPLICNLFHNFSISLIILSWRWRSLVCLFQLISVKSITILEFFGMYCLQIYTIQSCNYRISRPIRRTVNFSLENLEKNNDECILIVVNYWMKAGLLHTKISNHNIIFSSQKPRKSSSLPLKSSSWLFSLDVSLSSYKMSSYLPSAHKTQVEFRSHFSGKKVRLMGREIRYTSISSSSSSSSSALQPWVGLGLLIRQYRLQM